MNWSAFRNGIRGVVVAAVVLSLLLVAPFAINWANRGGRQPMQQDAVSRMDAAAVQKWYRLHPGLKSQPRPEGLTPFGRDFKAADVSPRDRIATTVGYLDLKNPGTVLDRVPAEFKTPGPNFRSHGKGTLQDGANIFQIDAASFRDQGYDSIAAEVARYGRILGEVPERGFLVRGKASALEALAAQPFVEATAAYRSAFKVDSIIGQMPLIQASRAKSTTLELQVKLWNGEDSEAAKGRLKQVLGEENVSDYSIDGMLVRVKAKRSDLAKLADDEAVEFFTEIPEMVLNNSEVPTIIMIGNTEESFMLARPYHELGIDGGGIDTNGDLQRVNNGTDTVPPQIVAVTDNGISGDAVHFSQTLTAVSDLSHAFPSRNHRKVHAIQNVEDTGSSCDGILSGSSTHGNVVAGVIAGAPGDFGLKYSKAVDPADGVPIQNLSLDALAKGSRIIMQDAGAITRCLSTELIEVGGNVAPGNLLDRLNLAICPGTGGVGACNNVVGGGDEVHLHVMPFGVPSWDAILNNPETSMYTLEAQQIDTFLVNNRDYMVFSPVGSQGTDPGDVATNQIWPDLFDGTKADDDPNFPRTLQIPPPATAKNSVTIGATFSDIWTESGNTNGEENDYNITSHGPATEASLRTAPILMTVGVDGSGVFAYPLFQAAATNRSHDNDNAPPVENEVDDQNYGTSYAAGFATAAGAIVRDYFAQGFYPTASRQTADRMPRLSGSLVRAALVASANFLEQALASNGSEPTPSVNDKLLANTRGTNLGSVAGVAVGVMGNNQQGYGRPVLDSVLPLPNYPPTRGIGGPDTIEYPASGLIIYDMLGTNEPPINNTSPVNCATSAGCAEKSFVVDGVNTFVAGSTRFIQDGQLRIALSWPDPPNAVLGTTQNGGSGTLINDLDLEVESPGPDNCLAPGDATPTGGVCPAGSATDNLAYDGNVYIIGKPLIVGQWSMSRGAAAAAVHDVHNTIEAVHLSTQVDKFAANNGNQLVTGRWKVRVRRGAGGAVPGQISMINGTNEDTDNSGRRDGAETDLDSDGLLDAGGQPFGLVVSGPVFGTAGQSQTWNSASHALPSSVARLDKYQYSCSDAARLTILDSKAGVTVGTVSTNTIFQVVNDLGAVLDEEKGIAFSETFVGSNDFLSAPVAVRLGSPAIKYNGVLEGDNSQSIVARYTDAPRSSEARARFQCTPNIIQGAMDINGMSNQTSFLGGGCDDDKYLDANERLTYSMAIQNYERGDDLNDVVATLTPTGLGAGAIRVLDSPKSVGRIPGGQRTGITFSIFVDPTVANNLAVANRKVTLTLNLDGSARGVRLSRTTYSFDHVINADTEAFHYSTDYPVGGREVRDFNRNLQIDVADKIDPFQGLFIPDEDITFSSLFIVGTLDGKVTNTLGEDLNDNGILDNATQTTLAEEVIPNGRLDRGILASATGPSAGDKVPWNFDSNDGGWFPLRSVFSKPGNINPNPMWEYKGGGLCSGGPTPGKQCFATADCGAGGTCNFHTGACGFNTTKFDGPNGVPPLNTVPWFQNGGAGIWHTGDADPTTPLSNSNTCDNYLLPNDANSPQLTEITFDVLESPIIAKVHQINDARGFPYTVEFQRLGVNINMQTADYAGGGIDLDNDIDSDARNCLVCQYIYGVRFPDIYEIAVFNSYERGIDPASSVPQRTFGPLVDPNGTFGQNRVIDGDEKGFTGFTVNTNTNSSSPIPVGDPEFTPFPRPGAPNIGAPGCVNCQGNPAQACCQQNTDAGPARNFDMNLLDYEDGTPQLSLGPGVNGPAGAFAPGPAKNRWQIGMGFIVQENPGGLTDYGIGFDDLVLEWDETHPMDEGAFVPAHTPACNRFGGAGQPAGQQCATLVVDRLNLYECNDTVEITVDDPRRSASPSITVFGVTDSDNVEVQTGVVAAKHPRKSFTIPAVPGNPGLFRGNVTLGSLFDNSSLLFTGVNDSNMTFYYVDPECDGDADGTTGEASFADMDNDHIAPAADNCPFDYNPGQENGICSGGATPGAPCSTSATCGVGTCSVDGDTVGSLCDNCPGVSNSSQQDSDADGVGDACDFDDIDFDGRVNGIDNCPDVYNPTQVPAQGGTSRGEACNGNTDADGDGIQDRIDKCVRTANAGQQDADQDGIGDACDGDCANPRPSTLATGTCNLISETFCTSDAGCPQVGTCSVATTIRCVADNGCPAQNTCINKVAQTCQRQGLINDGACGTVQDDADGDGVPDAVDDCPSRSNPPIIPETQHQLDTDQDGRGDQCDPAQTLDDDNNGIPDDMVTFNTVVSCKKVPLPQLIVLPGAPHDLNGDNDAFADAGEIVRMAVAVKNNSKVSVSGVSLLLTTIDPDISCITKSTILIPSIGAGQTINTLDLGAGVGEFEFIVSQATSTTNPTNPAKGDFSITLSSNEVVGLGSKAGFNILLDLDPPSGGLPGKVSGDSTSTSDNGTLKETFDLDRDGDGLFTIDSRCENVQGGVTGNTDPTGSTNCDVNAPGVKNDTIGVWVGTAPGGINVLAGIGCGGFIVPPADPECRIEPDNDMDWHIHCPPGALQASCPNSASHQTPVNDGMAHAGNNSLHWGYHFDLADKIRDTVKFRQLAAFMTNPINLTPSPGVGDLELSFFHIAAMMDNNWYNLPPGQANDYGDVQIQTDRNNNPAIDDWGTWDKLQPTENVYDHIGYIWSTFGTGITYCLLTPTDTGTAPPAPRGVHETMCYPLGIWSSCGNPRDQTTAYGCTNEVPGSVMPAAGALWAQTKFSLGSFLGQRVRIRWIAEAWEFDCCSSSYEEVGSWIGTIGDEGWYLDDIVITGALQAQAPPNADLKAVATGACPTKACDQTQGDSGFNVSLSVGQEVEDSIVVIGEKVIVSASATTNPGGCIGGGSQFKFFKDNVLVQDWSELPSYLDNPSVDATYRVQVRCSIDTTCTSSATATASNTKTIQVFTGDGQDIQLSVSRTAGVTTLSWPARVQPPTVSGYDAFRGTQADDGLSTTPGSPDTNLASLVPASGTSCNIPNTAPGTTVSVVATGDSALNAMHYYLIGHNPQTAGGQAALGRRGDGTLRPLAAVCP